MITTTRTYSRPSTSIEWHTKEGDHRPAQLENFLAIDDLFVERKLREINQIDDLTLEVTIVWFDDADYDAYWNNDAVKLYFDAVKSYYDQNGVQISDRVVRSIT